MCLMQNLTGANFDLHDAQIDVYNQTAFTI